MVVVVSVKEFRRLSGGLPDFKDYLVSGPSFEGLDLERSKDLPRELDF